MTFPQVANVKTRSARASCEKVFTGKASGKLARRELGNALMVAREGDPLVVTKRNRVGRTLENLIELTKELQKRGWPGRLDSAKPPASPKIPRSRTSLRRISAGR
ncbi:recombinase family protein [Streptomyces chartreusis]|uniref:Recombinase family protein n=1 Tax=Streptomyces chartreusis TaxID=1969 RepID=A0A7H8T3K0_STRCX|nr:recombinase family protein [Streptomyces chartreusis]QKZ17612.1 recombinase family protein [Streptomyces chartreusis]